MKFSRNLNQDVAISVKFTIPKAVCSLAFPKLAAGRRWGWDSFSDKWLGGRADYYCSEYSQVGSITNTLYLLMPGYDRPP